MSPEALVGISQACHIMRVSETSLRQWTDEGKIKAFVTPGGHRRYSEADLKKFMNSHQKAVGVKDLVSELEDAAYSLREMAKTIFTAKEWHSELDTDSQQHLANLGRDMLRVIIRYASEPSKREEIIEIAHNIGRDFGQTLAGIGLSLTDSVEAFIFHRDPIMNAVTSAMKKSGTFSGGFISAIPLVAHVMDEALVALVATHQQHKQTRVNKNRQSNS
jgi:excisionase family DNA binding protein